MGKATEPAAEIDPKVLLFALKFLNTATKEKLLDNLEGLTDGVAEKIIDQRLFGGLKKLDDIVDKKIMRKKKYEQFRDVVIEYATANKPKEKPTAEPAVDIDPKTTLFALKFLNTATKEKILDAFEDLNEAIVDKFLDQRTFGGLKKIDDILSKKIMRKKKYEEFRSVLLQYAETHKPKERPSNQE
ncbi:hypothetical protein ACHHYP_11676 [Achlya hypogyna]|uniref:Uncharacterized protein n=1 Tax=Achlya hypogyna TaxID=1202772 RepID=A0A1V9YIS2_ACHHY|nr:hypothetical protein ACHHYP_11676 [Achlya hypogyna]